MILNSFDINVISFRNIPSTYRCEIRDAERREFIGERVPGSRIIYCETAEDALLCERGRKRVYSYGANHYNFTDVLFKRSVRQRQPGVESMEVRIYNPQRGVDCDMLVIVSTRINGMYVQLYGGLYSECERNSYEVVRHDNKIYCEYSLFYIPQNITGDVYTSITVTLVPVSQLDEHRYYASDEYTLGAKSFVKDFSLNLKSRLEFRDDMLHLTACTDVTLKDFERQYKHVGIGTVESVPQILPDSYDVLIRLYNNYDMDDGNVLYERTFKDIIRPSENLDVPLIDTSFQIMNTLPDSSGIYDNIEINMLGEDVYGTHKLTWETVPAVMIGQVSIVYTCVNAYGEELKLEFESNPVPIIKDDIKYLIDKPSHSALNPYTEEYFNYKRNHMLHINITSVGDDKQPQQQPVSAVAPSVLYKPIFFRVQPAHTVTLVNGISQRVGINLQEYETKVACFYVKIGPHLFPERERTDTYVIFKIDSSLLEGTEQQYHVVDQDKELITSGKLIIQ